MPDLSENRPSRLDTIITFAIACIIASIFLFITAEDFSSKPIETQCDWSWLNITLMRCMGGMFFLIASLLLISIACKRLGNWIFNKEKYYGFPLAVVSFTILLIEWIQSVKFMPIFWAVAILLVLIEVGFLIYFIVKLRATLRNGNKCVIAERFSFAIGFALISVWASLTLSCYTNMVIRGACFGVGIDFLILAMLIDP